MSSRRNPHPPSGLSVEMLESRTLLSAGQLDPSFGSGGSGKVTVNFPGMSNFSYLSANGVTTQGNKTLIAGTNVTGQTSSQGEVVRLNFDGSLDTSWGANHNGIATFNFGSDKESDFTCIAPGPNNTVYVAGSDNPLEGGNFLVVRIRSDGTLDPTFGDHGQQIVEFGLGSEESNVTSIAIQRDGKIVLAGWQIPDFSTVTFALVRLNPNGSQDSSFNGDGTKTIDFPDDAYGYAVAIDYTGTPATNPHYGSIVVAGQIQDNSDKFSAIGAIRVTPSGHLDGSFNGNGQLFLRVPNFQGSAATGVAFQSNGDIILSGDLGDWKESGAAVLDSTFGIARFSPSGKLDKTFGNLGDGFAQVKFGGLEDSADSILLRSNDSIVVGGSSDSNMALVSLTSNGQLDGSFGTGGKVLTPFGDGAANGLAFMGDDIVAAGGEFHVRAARYIDTTPNVAVGAFITTATPQSPVTFIVGRTQVLPYDTLVDFSIGGTAAEPNFFFHTGDYSLNGMFVPVFHLVGQPLPPPSVDIPAGQSYVLVTLTPVAHSAPQPTKTASFTIIPSTFYNIGTPSSLTINIVGNNTASTTIGASADSYVQDGSNANTNFGSSTSLVVKSGSTGFNRFTYVKFDLSSVSTINSVQLQLFGNLSSTQNASVTTDVFSVANTSWTESGITFNNAPGAGPNPLASTTITGTGGAKYTWDVTAYVKAQKAAGNNIVSFVLKDPLASNAAVIFNSREAGMGPSLVIS